MSESLVPLRKVRSLSDIISAVIDTIRINIKPLSMGMLRYAGPWVVIGAAFLAYYQSASFQLLRGAADFGSEGLSIESGVGLTFLTAAIGYICLTLGYVATQVLIVAFLRLTETLGRAPSAEELHEEIRGKMGRAILVSVQMGLVLAAAFMLLAIPGIYLAIPFTMFYAVVHMENRGTMDAMKRCVALVRNKWWWTFGVLIVLVILESVIAMVLTAPAQILGIIQLVTISDGSSYSPSLTMQILTISFTTVGYLATAFLRLITTTGSMFIYSSHKERLEGTSLLERIETIGQTTQPQ